MQSLTPRLSRCRQAGEHDECVALVDTLHSVGLRGNPNMYLSLIEALADAARHEQLLHVYGGMRRAGVRQSNQTHTVVLASLLRAERVAEAAKVARELRAEPMRDEYLTFDLGLRNVILQALLRHGDVNEVRQSTQPCSAVVCGRVLSCAVVCGRMRSYAVVCGCAQLGAVSRRCPAGAAPSSHRPRP